MVLALAATASALPEGYYFTPKIGYSLMQVDKDARLDIKNGGGNYAADGSHALPGNGKNSNGQITLGLALGYDFNQVYDGTPMRAEVEYAWRRKDEIYSTPHSLLSAPGSTSPPGAPGTGSAVISQKGEIEVHSLFINAYFDNGFNDSTTVAPYIGAGLGLAVVSAEYQLYCDDARTPPSLSERVDLRKTKANFAWNVGGGVAWEIADSVALDLGYRYADFGKVDLATSISAGGSNVGIAVDHKVTSHEVLLGIRQIF